ncbi:unnamed protein product [Arctogadus glacialis]
MNTISFFPGKMTVSFRKGPSGHRWQDPSSEATRIKQNPGLQDKSPAQKHDLVKTSALTVVFQRGGDASDRQEEMGEYRLQFGKSFQEIQDLRNYLISRKPTEPVASEGDNIVGFGRRSKTTWRQIWESRADGYAAYILRQKCIKNSKMYNLQQYILKQERVDSCPTPAEGSTTSTGSTSTSGTLVMEEDEELERQMLNRSPSIFDTELRINMSTMMIVFTAHRTKPPATVSRPAEPDDPTVTAASMKATAKALLLVPPQLLAIAPELGIKEQGPETNTQKASLPQAFGVRDNSSSISS